MAPKMVLESGSPSWLLMLALLVLSARAPAGDMLDWEATEPVACTAGERMRARAGNAVVVHARDRMKNEIVLATRLGSASAAPAEVAKELARELGARITVVYVATELHAIDIAGGEAGVDPALERARVLADVQAGLDDFVALYFGGGPDVGVRIEQGQTAEAVTRVAAELDARLLVVGTRGRGKLARLVLGDTTQNILQRTPCPVVVVPLKETGS